MKLRYLVVLATGAAFFLWVGSATARTVYPTKITLDSSVAVGHGNVVDSGRVINSNGRCNERAVKLVGTYPDGRKRLLDWTLTSIPGKAWATKSKRTGLEKAKAKIRRSKFGRRGHRKVCAPASVLVFRQS